ncbi:MAG TPA: hypothetical protein VMT96_00430 [Candidatus Bathyarchaeia archaeon]|nr:hypothetical protein [Candidatus Bathyarchaeia archaeon]
MANFDLLSSLAIVLLAAATHASFQLSVSMLTLLSGHALGKKTAHMQLMRLVGSFTAGAGVMIVLLLSTIALVLNVLLPVDTPPLMWAACSGAAVGVGVSVWAFYFRQEPGTSLWIPRSFARFLGDRAKTTQNPGEAFSLGLTSIISELLFTFAPLAIAALVLVQLTPTWQLIGILLYSGVALLPLLIVGLLIGGGHKLSRIQSWREKNKLFLQFAAGSALLVLGAYVYVERVFTVGVSAVGGQ